MSKLWGGRFAAGPDAAMKALNDSIGFDVALYAADIAGSMAYAGALEHAEVLTPEESIKIQEGLERILLEFEDESFTIQPDDEDIHTAVERRLTELIGPVAGKLHTGRSRNDQVATDIRLWVKEALDELQELVRDLQGALVTQATAHTATPLPGYTHFQPAQPITVAQWLLSFFWMLERDHQRLGDALRRADLSPLGASALPGTPYPIDRETLAQDLGFAGAIPNSLDAISDRDFIAETLFAAALLGTHLSKFAEDIIIYANPALGFVNLPDAFSTGSSIMPQKRNPDPLELARGKAGRLLGNLTGFMALLKGLPSGYNKDLQDDKEPLFDTVHTLQLLLPVLTGFVGALTFDEARLRAALDEGLLATELADYLVAKGMPFREAHHVVGGVVQACETEGVTLSALPLERYQALSEHFGPDVYEWLSIEAALANRNALGGTAPEAVAVQLTHAQTILESDTQA